MSHPHTRAYPGGMPSKDAGGRAELDLQRASVPPQRAESVEHVSEGYVDAVSVELPRDYVELLRELAERTGENIPTTLARAIRALDLLETASGKDRSVILLSDGRKQRLRLA
jgi:hypothetical protein